MKAAALFAASLLVTAVLTGCSTDFYPLDGQNEVYYTQHRNVVPFKSPGAKEKEAQ